MTPKLEAECRNQFLVLNPRGRPMPAPPRCKTALLPRETRLCLFARSSVRSFCACSTADAPRQVRAFRECALFAPVDATFVQARNTLRMHRRHGLSGVSRRHGTPIGHCSYSRSRWTGTRTCAPTTSSAKARSAALPDTSVPGLGSLLPCRSSDLVACAWQAARAVPHCPFFSHGLRAENRPR